MKSRQQAEDFEGFLNKIAPFLRSSVVKMDEKSFQDDLFGVRVDLNSDTSESIFVRDGFFIRAHSDGVDSFEIPESSRNVMGYLVAFNSAAVDLGVISASKLGKLELAQTELSQLQANIDFVERLLQSPRSEDLLSAEEEGYCKTWLQTLQIIKQAS